MTTTPNQRGGSKRASPLRLTPDQDALIRDAAAATGQSLTEFVTMAAVTRAEDTLADRRVFRLDDAAWSEFSAILDRPAERIPAPTKLLSERAPNLVPCVLLGRLAVDRLGSGLGARTLARAGRDLVNPGRGRPDRRATTTCSRIARSGSQFLRNPRIQTLSQRPTAPVHAFDRCPGLSRKVSLRSRPTTTDGTAGFI